MTPHVVRPDAEEKAGAHMMLAQQFQQAWHAVAGATKGIDINA